MEQFDRSIFRPAAVAGREELDAAVRADDRLRAFSPVPLTQVDAGSWGAMFAWLQAHPWTSLCEPESKAVLYVTPDWIAACDRGTWETSMLAR